MSKKKQQIPYGKAYTVDEFRQEQKYGKAYSADEFRQYLAMQEAEKRRLAAEQERMNRVVSQYSMSRANPAPWMNGGPAARMQAGLDRMQQANEQKEQKPYNAFTDLPKVQNLMDPNSKVNQLIKTRSQEEQDYWQGVRQDIGKAMNRGKGNDRASQLLRPLTMEERMRQKQEQMESLGRVAQGTPINPLQNPRQYAQETYDIRSGGTYTGDNPLMMNPDQLVAWKRKYQNKLDQATRTDEQQARLHEMTEEAGEQNRIYYELNNRGLPVMRNMNGEPYVPDVAEWGGLDSTQFIRKRPEEYYTDDSTKTEYDRMMYDAIHGKGAYDAILYADETTDEDIDAMDAEAEHLWRQLEGGNFNVEERAAQENYYGAFNRENDNRTAGYQRNINLADQYIGNWNRIAELEAGAPQGEYGYREELGTPKWTDWTDLNKMKMKDLYRYANMDMTDEDMADVQRYGNLRPIQFMTDAQRNTFNAYFENGKYAEAQAYYDAMEPYLLQMKNEYRTLLEQRMYNNGGAIPMTLYRIATKPVEGVAGLGLTAAGLLGNEEALNTNSEWWDLSRTNQNIQNTSADAWARQAAKWFGGGDKGFAAQAGRFLNGVFFSMADNLTAFALSGGASKVSADAAEKLTQSAIQFIMSSEATAGTMFEQLEAGADPTRAAIMSFGSGIIEAITEKYSLEQILDPDVRAVLGTKGAFMKYLGKASFAEGSEEIASDLLDTGLDFIMSAAYGDAPELIRNYEDLIAEGMSKDEATRKVLGDYLTQLGSDGLAGALSGLLMSGSRGVQARGLDSYQTRSIGSTVVNRNVEEGMTAKEKSGEQYSNFLKLNDAAKMLQPGSEARRIAQEIEADVKKGGKVSMKKAGKLTRAIMQESNEQIGQVADAVLGDTLTQQLRDEGIAPEDAEKYSSVLKDAAETGRMTPEAMLILSQDERARGLWSEIVKSEDVQSARAAQKSVMDLITTPGERAAENIRENVAAKMAVARYVTEKDEELQEALAAGEKRTGSPMEVVVDGKIGNVTGFGLKEKKGKNGTTWAVTAKVETADGTIEVNLSDVLSTNEKTAQVLQMVQAENGQSIGERMTMQLLKIAQNTKDIAGAATDAISIAMDDLLGEKTKVTTLSKTEEQAMRAALEEDKKAADAEAAQNQKQLNPGKAKIVLNGVEYGSQKFAQELGKFGAQIRDEANYVAKLMKSIGMDVEFYYDNSEEGSARQGAFVGKQGIRLNLAGTFTSDGVHRSVVATAAHEATHWLRANAQDAYRQLQTYALKGLQNANVNVRNELRRIMDNYELYGEHLTMDKAAEEMTAMGCEEIFTNEQLVSDLQAEDPTLYGKVKQAVQHVMNLLRKVAGENMATSSRRYAQKLRGTLDQLAKVWKITYEAAKGATETGTATETKVSNSLRDEDYADAVARGDWTAAENMLIEKMQQTEGITGYRAPYFYAGEHKDIARMIKSGDPDVINSIVDDMAQHVPENAVLVPMPPHEGKVTESTDTRILAEALSKKTGAPVIVALESDYHPSRYQAKASGDRSVNAQTMGFRQVEEIPEGKMPVFIDNMVGGGQTAIAAKNAIGRGITLAYAQSSRSKTKGVKIASVTYDSEGNLIPLSQRMDPENPSWKFSMRDTVEERADGLIALHNLEEEQLMKTLQLGGFAMPSIAVIKSSAGHSKYGPISVVFKPSTIDPKASKSNKVYGGDAWTPTYPTVEYKINSKVLTNLINKVNRLVPREVLNGIQMNSIDEKNTEDAINSARGDYVKALKRNMKLKLAYLADKGINIEYPMREQQLTRRFSNDQIRQIIDELGEEKIRKANESSSAYLDEHPEIAETMRKIKAEEWEKEIRTKIETEDTVLKMLKMNPYSKEEWGFSQTNDGIYGAVRYLNSGIKQEVDEKALSEVVNENLDEAGYEEWLRQELNGIIAKKGIRNNKNYYTDYGNPRSWEQLHDEETLENVVRIMKAEADKGSNSFFSQSEMLAIGTRDFKSLDDIRKHSDQLRMMDDEEYTATKQKIVDGFGQLMDEMYDKSERNYLIARDRALEAMVDAVRRTRNPAGIERELRQWNGLNVREGMGQEIADLLEQIADLPTGYFEAKPKRAVYFDEIEKVIIPETASIELTNALDQRGIPYDTYDGTEEDRLRVLNEQQNAMFSIRDDTDYDVRQWMETVPEWSLQTEAEKQLLSKYKSLQMKQRLDRERMRKIDSDLLKLEAQLTEERTGRIEAEETMENALESAGVSVRDGHWLQKDGKIIGKINTDGTIGLNKGVEENVYQTLRAAGFGFTNKKGIFRPAMSAPQNADGKPTIQALLGKSEAQRQRDALQKRKQDLQKTMDEQEIKLAEITKDEGFGKMMFQQQKVLDDLQSFGTQRELMDYVARMEKKAQEVAARIEENRKATEALEKGDVVKRFRELLGTTTAEKTAAELKKEFSSTWTAKQIQAYLNPIILKMKSGQDFQQDVETLAGILVSSDSRNRYEALEDLRGLVITIGKGAQRELKAQNSSLKEVRARLAGTGIQVKYGDRSTLEADIEDLRAEYPMIPELGDEKDALGNFLNWVDSMKSVSAGMEFYDQRIAEAMAVITGKAAGAAKGIYMPNDPKAQQQVLAIMDFVKGLNAETAEVQKALADIAAQMGEMQKAGMAATNRATTLMRDVNVAIDYYQKIGKIAADEAKQKKQSAVIEQLKSKHAEEIVKNNEEWRALVQRDKDARAQLDENRKMTRQINTNLKRTFNLLKNPKGLQNIPEYMQGLAREVISKFVDNDLGRGARFIQATQKELTEWRRILDAWEAQNGKFDRNQLGAMDAENVKADVVLADLDKIADGMKQLNAWKIYGKNKLDALQQRGAIIEQIRDAVSEIYTAIRAEGEVQAGDRRVAVEDAAYEVAKGTGGKKYREWTGSMGQKMSWLHKAIVSGNMTPEYFFRTLGNQGLSDLWENYHWAENKNGLELKKAKDRLAQIAEEYGYKNWDMKQKIKLNLQSGEVEITLGQMMSLWATWQREKTLGPEMSQHLTHGGFFADVDLRDGLLGRATVEKRAHRVTEEDMDYVLTQLTVDQMNFIDAVVKFMSNDMSELGNTASMQAYGIKLYKESYYFPFQMWDGVKSRKSNDAGGAAAANDRAFHPSFSKSRQHGANNAVMIGDFMQVVTDHIAGMINYATMGLANENLQKVLNAQTAEEYDTKRNTWALIEEAYGREAAQYLRKLQEQLNGGAVHIDKTFYDKLISLFRKNAVAGSLSVALQQPISYIRAAMMINPKYLARAISPDMWRGSYKEMLAHSGVAVIKDMGRFDMNFGQSAKEFLLPDGKEGKVRKVWEGIEEYSTKLPELMDRMTWTRMWSAVKAEQHAEHPEMDVKSDEFLDLCGRRFNDIMRRTQVYDSTLVKSANMRNQNPVIKTLTSFMAEPTLTLNVLADSVRMAKNREKGGMLMVGKASGLFLLSAVLQAAVKGLMGTGRTPDDKKTWWENFLYRFEYNFLNEADILQLVPGFSDAVTILKGGELKDDAWGALSKMIKAGSGTVDLLLRGSSDKGLWRDVEDSGAQLVQMFTGVPLKNLMRDGRAMWNWTIDRPYATRADSAAVIGGQATDLFYNADNLIGVLNTWLGEAGYSTNNNAYYARIYEAKKTGDDKRAQNLIDYLLLGKGIKQESIDSKIAGMAKKDENASAADTAEFLIAEGANAEDYITDRMRKKELTADEARDLLQKADPTKDADSIWWTVDRIQYKLETGAEKVSGNYYRLKDAISGGKIADINAAVDLMKKHGFDNERIKDWIGRKDTGFKTAYLEATGKEKVRIKNALIMAYKAIGINETEANKIINKWK